MARTLTNATLSCNTKLRYRARIAAEPDRSTSEHDVQAPRRRRPGGRAARVRAAAIAATLAELAESGYTALSLERVAQRAGVHKTTLYRRWGSREELVLEAMLERAGQ